MARLKLQHGSRKRIPAAMVRMKSKKRSSARDKARDSAWREQPPQEATFLPSNEHLVKMIAMQGADDAEIAKMFGVPYEHFKAWRKLYPSFNDALNAGRLSVDAEVTYALFKQTQGFEYSEQSATP